MDRAKIQEQLEALYEARLSNDSGRCARLFAEGAEFRFANASPVFALPGALDTKSILSILAGTWKWKEVRDLTRRGGSGDPSQACREERGFGKSDRIGNRRPDRVRRRFSRDAIRLVCGYCGGRASARG